MIRVARPSDARHVHGLLQSYAERGLLRRRSLDEIGRTIEGFVVAVDGDGKVVGCGALRVHSDKVAEIAALAVEESRQGQGVGGRIVRTLEREARTRGIRRVFTRTLQPGFFHKLGFSTTNVHAFPETIDWGQEMADTVVLAYSGGLDTSVIVPWLRETYNVDVICVAADVGQGEELTGLDRRAKQQGASALLIEDLREAFVTEAIWPTLRAGAIYARKYLLGTAMARPVIARRQAELAVKLGASALAHGCTGKGNDQVRFELTYAAFAPNLNVIVPWREWSIRSREDAIAYAAARGLDMAVTPGKIYSRDRNLWHVSHEGGPLEDPGVEPLADVFQLTRSPEDAPDRPCYVEIGFEHGYPVTVDGDPLAPVELVQRLNEIGGEHGIGRADIIEDRLVGMKSRGVYETPGGTLLYTAHRELEQLVLDRRALALKDGVAARYADLVYDGRWWSAEREALDALVDATQRRVTGTVRLKLYKGNVIIAGRQSPCPLYDESLASFGDAAPYDHADAAGFIRLFALPTRMEAQHFASSESRVPSSESLPTDQPEPAGRNR